MGDPRHFKILQKNLLFAEKLFHGGGGTVLAVLLGHPSVVRRGARHRIPRPCRPRGLDRLSGHKDTFRHNTHTHTHIHTA